jgi:hypothetical protein
MKWLQPMKKYYIPTNEKIFYSVDLFFMAYFVLHLCVSSSCKPQPYHSVHALSWGLSVLQIALIYEKLLNTGTLKDIL